MSGLGDTQASKEYMIKPSKEANSRYLGMAFIIEKL